MYGYGAGIMTDKECVLSIYPEAKLIRWNYAQAAISIGTEREPYLTLGWIWHRIEEDESIVWREAKKIIAELMLQKLES